MVHSSWHDSSNSTSQALAYGTKVTPVLPTKLCKANISWHKVADLLYACSRVSMIAQHIILFSQSLNSNRFSLCHFWVSGPEMAHSCMALHQTFASLQWSWIIKFTARSARRSDHADVKIGSDSLSWHVTNHMCWLFFRHLIKQRQHEYQLHTWNRNTSSMTQTQISNTAIVMMATLIRCLIYVIWILRLRIEEDATEKTDLATTWN